MYCDKIYRFFKNYQPEKRGDKPLGKDPMKGLLRVGGEFIFALWVVNRLPVETIWEACGFLMMGMLVPVVFAIINKQAGDMLALAAVYASVSGVGGFYAPGNWHILIWGVGIIGSVSFLVVGLILKFGLHTKPLRYDYIHQTADEDGIMYAKPS